MGDQSDGGGAAELRPMASHSTSFAEPQIGAENWAAAERAAREIIRKVQPTSVSEERRKAVVEYIQRLIRSCLRAEVFPYGSVPLKTYLPDGDIDLTAFVGTNVEDALADAMKSVFEEEEKNTASEFVVKDVRLIRAEVKLVKCIVQDIVVDVTFNQIGGLCTLCFLEQVDRLIGKDHLFKRSIILIKAWCYYESRILGAHHGLISTYALETLALYIFHLYHSTLDGPLAVLYKFLDYFSKFDWEIYCISLNGPVRLSSLPAIVAEMPEDSDRDLLLSSDFLSSCVGKFSVPSRGEKNSRGFQRKHLNIVDPLKEINNLGRSVSRGNFYRIRSAFSYGARKLARILLQPPDSIANELHKFFANTMARHGGGQRPDVQVFEQSLIYNRPISAVPVPEAGLCRSDNFYEYFDEHAVSTGDFQPSSGKLSQDLLKGIERTSDTENREQCNSLVLDQHQPAKANDLSPHLWGDSNNLTTSGLGVLKISDDSSICQTRSRKESASVVRSDEDGAATVGRHDENELVDKDEAVASSKARDVFRDQRSSPSRDRNHVDSEQGPASRSGTPESLNSSDLTGDYETYLQCLRYGQWCYEHDLVMHSLPMPSLPTAPYRSNALWDGLLPLSHHKQNGFSHPHHNGYHLNPAVCAVQPILLPGVTFGWEELPKPRGMGTYFPTTNLPLQGYRSSAMKGRNQASSKSPRNNGRNMILTEPNMLDSSSHEPSQPQVPIDKSVTVSSSDSYLPFSPHQNGFGNPTGVVEFELAGHASGTSTLENRRPQRPVSSSPRTFSGMQKSQTALSREQDRMSLRSSYRLKDEDDFPPLST